MSGRKDPEMKPEPITKCLVIEFQVSPEVKEEFNADEVTDDMVLNYFEGETQKALECFFRDDASVTTRIQGWFDQPVEKARLDEWKAVTLAGKPRPNETEEELLPCGR